jgi:hypothetical protein
MVPGASEVQQDLGRDRAAGVNICSRRVRHRDDVAYALAGAVQRARNMPAERRPRISVIG